MPKDEDINKNTKKKAQKERGLGRGLSALMADMSIPAEPNENDVIIKDNPETIKPRLEISNRDTLRIDKLVRNPDQPRRIFDPVKLKELTESIRLKGVLQPILVRPIPDPNSRNETIYQIVAGERRWQASQNAGLETIPVLIRELSDQDVLEVGVIENVHRANLNAIEEAQAYKALTEQFNRTQDEIAKAIGKSRPYITNMLRLLTLPQIAQDMLRDGKITMGHARAIISAENPIEVAHTIIDKKLSVRKAEQLIKKMREPKVEKPNNVKSADIRSLETELMDVLGLKVDLRHKGPKGELRVHYSDNDQLDDIVRRLKSN